MKDTMTLKDGSVIELEAGASLGALQVMSADQAAMVEIWSKLTPDNLSSVQIKNGDGLAVGTHEGLVLVSETSIVLPDGKVLTAYSLRAKTELERISERVAAVEETTDVLLMEALGGGEA